jgi:hypothetical protein
VPVSTTHTITGAIVGVGTTRRLSAVRWGVATRIVWAWVLTIPSAGAVAALVYAVTVSRFALPALLAVGGAAVVAIRVGRRRAGSATDAGATHAPSTDHGPGDVGATAHGPVDAGVANAADADAAIDDLPVAP